LFRNWLWGDEANGIGKFTILFLVAALLVSCNQATATPGSSPEHSATKQANLNMQDVLYVPEGAARQRLNVYLPAEGNGPFPTVLTIHGGGFRARSKNMYSQIAAHLNQLGYAAVSTNYRLTPNYSYPAQVEDVFCALAWIHANSEEYGFDQEHIFV
jgi:acetyl esterase/lipase